MNLSGVFNCCKVFGSQMVKQRKGTIVNIASIAGVVSGPRMGPYSVAKAGIISLTETIRIEVAEYPNINASVVCPSYVQTNLAADAVFDGKKL